MTVKEIAQSILDRVLLPDGITSHHLRRVEVDQIGDGSTPVNPDEYVVFSRVTGKGSAHGDGKAQLMRTYLDVNYYYAYEKDGERFDEVERRIKKVIGAFLADPRFLLVNGERDLPETDNPFRGINVELLFVGVADYEQ